MSVPQIGLCVSAHSAGHVIAGTVVRLKLLVRLIAITAYLVMSNSNSSERVKIGLLSLLNFDGTAGFRRFFGLAVQVAGELGGLVADALRISTFI